MARRNLSDTVISASQVILQHPVEIVGKNKYTLASNFISWEDNNSYQLSSIARNFGVIAEDSNDALTQSRGRSVCCGDSVIQVYDFGLLYSTFCAMIMADVELGTSFPIEEQATTNQDLATLWFGNDGIVYGVTQNIIIPLKNKDVEEVCSNTKVIISNFSDERKFELTREGNNFVISTEIGEFVCKFSIPSCVRKSYQELLESATVTPVIIGVDADGDGILDNSGLGRLLDYANKKKSIDETESAYRKKVSLETVVVRDDLICTPDTRYGDTAAFFGSLCYTDKKEIALPVNIRRGLFIYNPWYAEDGTSSIGIKVDPTSDPQQFYDVTEVCTRITRFAHTVAKRPLTQAEFDITVFEKIKSAFFDLKLTRLPLCGAFGRIVIPETTLLRELESQYGESLFCIVPVGLIGERLIVLSAEGYLQTTECGERREGEMYYDVTEVLRVNAH